MSHQENRVAFNQRDEKPARVGDRIDVHAQVIDSKAQGVSHGAPQEQHDTVGHEVRKRFQRVDSSSHRA